MFLKGSIIYNPGRVTSILIPVVILLAICGCAYFETSQSNGNGNDQTSQPDNLFNIPSQIIADESVRSIRFHRVGNPTSAPVLNLDGSEQLQLQFEKLGIESNQFRISVSHHNPDWSRSGLPPERFINGFYENLLSGGQVSRNNRPTYRQYSFIFPNEQFRITKSGNYMLKVEDADTGYLVFSIPFFVSENAASAVSSIEEFSGVRERLRTFHRPVTRYSLPDFVDQPQFDLEFYFVQNRFWGRSRKADELDFSAPDHVQFELSRSRSFLGDYEFRRLTLDRLSQSDNSVIEAFPEEIPPRLILRDDEEGFGNSISAENVFSPFGDPDMSLNSGYANTVFRFDIENQPDSSASIHLLGDFNNWSVNSNNRLEYDEDTGLWTTSVVLKKGSYKYKYVVVKDEAIDDLYYDELFTDNRQQYHAFVYMRDSREFYYRLLQVQSFFSE